MRLLVQGSGCGAALPPFDKLRAQGDRTCGNRLETGKMKIPESGSQEVGSLADRMP